MLSDLRSTDLGHTLINTTSGIKDQPEQAGYSASKAALDKFTKDLGPKLEGTNV